MLEVESATAPQLTDWADRVRRMHAALGWPEPELLAASYASGASLAFAAADDRLFTATEVNEWAWQGAAFDALRRPLPCAPGHPASWDDESARQSLARLAAAEACPAAIALLDEAARRGLPGFYDEAGLSLGAGQGSRLLPTAMLHASMPEVDWESIHDVSTALVTGSNGKTTTVRLLAAMFAASGTVPGFNCTDGIFVAGEQVEQGDYSGPSGARQVLRDRRVQAAVLETARGGILRRGLAVRRAHAAIVTNVSPDHFGEYGVHDLDGLASAKLVVARAISATGCLVLNADDPVLLGKSAALDCPLAWFARDEDHPVLMEHRHRGGATCGLSGRELRLHLAGEIHELGGIEAMPLTFDGSAGYNIANISGAALLAACLGIEPKTITQVLATFGGKRGDNPGRLERWNIGGSVVLLDYAHNPDGLAGLLAVARDLATRSKGRLGLLLGQAGNREDAAIRHLARVAAASRPDFVVLKELEGYLRGRAIGEVPGILEAELLAGGMARSGLRTILPEVEAAQAMLAWARPGDIVVLPVHDLVARAQLVAWLDARESG